MPLNKLINLEIIKAMESLQALGEEQISSSRIMTMVPSSPATLKRHLEELVNGGLLIRTGKARSTRYQLAPRVHSPSLKTVPQTAEDEIPFALAPQSQALMTHISLPLAMRAPVTYQRSFVDQYVPNQTSLLPGDLAQTLATEGRIGGQQPAGTYARRVYQQLLIDLSWSSSRLEGNRYTLLATEELFKLGAEGSDSSEDAIMLLNHKQAIEFLVESIPEYGLNNAVICNLQALLMRDLLHDPHGLGAIRNKIVFISDTVYLPCQVPTLLGEMLSSVIDRACLIKNPVEAAFFLWVNIAYLQPFEDGNKRTSRLAANIPLLMYNCAPLSFLDADPQLYAKAMIGIYERLDPSLAVDLFAWTYRRSILKYKNIVDSFGGPDPFRLKYREQLSIAIQHVVRDGKNSSQVVSNLNLPTADHDAFITLLEGELRTLSIHNCARYRLSLKSVENWLAQSVDR